MFGYPRRSAALVLVVIVALSSTAHAQENRPPNIVFIYADDLGYMDLGCYNPDTFYRSPHLDQLAAEGTLFTDGYASCPVCSPSRYSIQTGKYPTRAQLTNWLSGRRSARFQGAPFREYMPLEEVTIAQALKKAGYRTAFLGKWHLGPSEQYWPEVRGYDVNIGGHDRGSPPGGYFSPYKNPRLKDGPDGEYLTNRLGEESVKLIDQFKDDPFFLFLSFYVVHTPLQAPNERVAEYQKKKAQLPPGEDFGPEEQVWPVDQERHVRIRQNHPTYAAMVQGMDSTVGMVLDKLKQAGLEENTIVIFTSDNGGLSTSEGSPTSNLPLRGGKGWLYEGGTRVPYLIKWPGVTKPGSVCKQPVTGNDFYPTFLQMAGLDLMPEQHQDAVSLVPVLKDPDAKLDREALYWHYPHYANQGGFPGGSMRAGDWKLIERYEDGRVHLYNLADDLGERTDLAKEMPDRVNQMRQKLHAWYRDVDAKFLEPKPGKAETDPMPWRPGD